MPAIQPNSTDLRHPAAPSAAPSMDGLVSDLHDALHRDFGGPLIPRLDTRAKPLERLREAEKALQTTSSQLAGLHSQLVGATPDEAKESDAEPEATLPLVVHLAARIEATSQSMAKLISDIRRQL
ncbi:hypothetical protein NKG99_20570 [Mesorhizobium sp. M1409]|uniref:hypothetical protein n=1 Tax=Mesorhizobium sp. M1409 TaxID=2957100 RepID=UPI00333ACE69